MTQQELIDKLNREAADQLQKEGTLFGSLVDVLRIENTEMGTLAMCSMPLGSFTGGKYRVAMWSWYLNKANRAQATIYLKDFAEVEDAEDLVIAVLERHGGLAFGDVFKLSLGSGLRFVKRLD